MHPTFPSALVVGATEDIDLFLRALAWDRRQVLQVEGLLAVGARQTGRRIHGYPFLGSIEDTAAVLERLAARGGCPTRWWSPRRTWPANRSPFWSSRRNSTACESAARRVRPRWIPPGRRTARAQLWICGRWRSRTC